MNLQDLPYTVFRRCMAIEKACWQLDALGLDGMDGAVAELNATLEEIGGTDGKRVSAKRLRMLWERWKAAERDPEALLEGKHAAPNAGQTPVGRLRTDAAATWCGMSQAAFRRWAKRLGLQPEKCNRADYTWNAEQIIAVRHAHNKYCAKKGGRA